MPDLHDLPIAVGIDGSAYSDRALRWAIREAQLRKVALTLVHAYQEDGITQASQDACHELARRLALDVVARHRGLLDQVEGHDLVVRASARPASLLLEVARHAQLVVVGTRGLGGFGELLLGSTSHRVVLHSHVPVALVRTPAHHDPVVAEEHDGRRPIVVGVDATPEAQAALRWAFDEACWRDVGVLAVHALDAPDAATLRTLGLPVELVAARLAEARASARDEVDAQIDAALPLGDRVRLNRIIDDGPPVISLLRRTTAEHLLVLGTRGRRALAEVGPGSVSRQVAHHAAGPMVVVPRRI